MAHVSRYLWTLLGVLALAAPGCHQAREFYFHENPDHAYYQGVAMKIEPPLIDEHPPSEATDSLPPRSLDDTTDPASVQYWDLSLEDAIRIALERNKVMRDLGGRVVQNPDSMVSVYDPGIADSNPRYGTEGALSLFDPQFNTIVGWGKDDRVVNNLLLGGGSFFYEGDNGNFRTQIAKTTATGTQFAIRQINNYTANNLPAQQFPSYWDSFLEAQFNHPFLQGGGVTFNRIAGPGATPGLYFQNGVMLARVDADATLSDFERGVTYLVSDVENAYWELYFAYRDLDAKRTAQQSALETWRKVNRLLEGGGRGGTVGNEAQAAAQYYRFRADVENALSGRPGTENISGRTSTGGTFVGAGGVYAREANLRLMLGLPNNDGRLIRPKDEPVMARVRFDWQGAVTEALARRVELRKQRWLIKRAELEVIGNRNFLLPRLDAQALYRWRGFGNKLLENGSNLPEFSSSFQNLTSGQFTEWQTGLVLDMPIGFRKAHAAVRHAQLKLARQRAVLDEQERTIVHDLGESLREVYRAFTVTQTLFNRRVKAQQFLDATQREFDAGLTTLDVVMIAQRELVDTEAEYARSLVQYAIALKAAHMEKGTLLEYDGVFLSEGPWPAKAYVDAARRARARSAAWPINYAFVKPCYVACGEQDRSTIVSDRPLGSSPHTLPRTGKDDWGPDVPTIPTPVRSTEPVETPASPVENPPTLDSLPQPVDPRAALGTASGASVLVAAEPLPLPGDVGTITRIVAAPGMSSRPHGAEASPPAASQEPATGPDATEVVHQATPSAQMNVASQSASPDEPPPAGSVSANVAIPSSWPTSGQMQNTLGRASGARRVRLDVATRQPNVASMQPAVANSTPNEAAPRRSSRKVWDPGAQSPWMAATPESTGTPSPPRLVNMPTASPGGEATGAVPQVNLPTNSAVPPNSASSNVQPAAHSAPVRLPRISR